MNEHRESLNLLITTHAVIKQTRYHDIASKTRQLQLQLAPVICLAIGLYKTWDGPTFFSFKLNSELEHANLALLFFVPSVGRLIKSSVTPSQLHRSHHKAKGRRRRTSHPPQYRQRPIQP